MEAERETHERAWVKGWDNPDIQRKRYKDDSERNREKKDIFMGRKQDRTDKGMQKKKGLLTQTALMKGTCQQVKQSGRKYVKRR